MKTMIFLLLLSSLKLSAESKQCYEFDLNNHQNLSIEIPKKDGFITLSLKTKTKKHLLSFYCHLKEKEYNCSGDDDRGMILIKNNKIKIKYLNFGNPDEFSLIEIKGRFIWTRVIKSKCTH